MAYFKNFVITIKYSGNRMNRTECLCTIVIKWTLNYKHSISRFWNWKHWMFLYHGNIMTNVKCLRKTSSNKSYENKIQRWMYLSVTDAVTLNNWTENEKTAENSQQ